MEDKISKKVKLENAFWGIGICSILLSLIIAVNYENVFLAEIVLLVVVLMILAPLGKYINTLCEKDWRMANIEDLYRGQEVLVLQFKDSSIIGGINYEKEFRVYDFSDEYISLIDEHTPDNLGRSFTEYLFKREELENNIMILS